MNGKFAIAGWSASEQPFVGYRFSVLASDDPGKEPELTRFGLWIGPSLDEAAEAEVGILKDGKVDLSPEKVIAYFARVRAEREKSLSDPDGPSFHAVGGFVSETVMGHDAADLVVQTRIIHRWPDAIGERITP